MKKKILIICGCVLAVGILLAFLWPLPLTWLAQIKGLLGNGAFWVTMGIIAGILAVGVVAYFWLVPMLIYVFKKLYVYISLAWICMIKKYKFRMKRVPFASLGKLSESGDLTITTDEGTLHLHFLDVVFAYRRALTVPGPHEYVITPVTTGHVSKAGGGAAGTHMGGGRRAVLRVTDHKILGNSDHSKAFPHVESRDGEKHLLILQSMPIQCTVLRGGVSAPLGSGDTVGAFTFYRVGQLKKGLKKQLHTSLMER